MHEPRDRLDVVQCWTCSMTASVHPDSFSNASARKLSLDTDPCVSSDSGLYMAALYSVTPSHENEVVMV